MGGIPARLSMKIAAATPMAGRFQPRPRRSSKVVFSPTRPKAVSKPKAPMFMAM